jgi:hypothetical protein
LVLLAFGGLAAVEGGLEGVQGRLAPVDSVFVVGVGRVRAHDRGVGALECGLLVRELAAGLHGLAYGGVGGLDRVCRAGRVADLGVEVQEWVELGLCRVPQLGGRRVLAAPGGLELDEPLHGRLLGCRGVDRAQRLGQGVAVLAGRVA